MQYQMVIDVPQVQDKYVGHTFECQRCTFKTTTSNVFVDCNFPQLVSLSITKPAELTFVRCTFPKLRSVNYTYYQSSEPVFLKCGLSGYIEDIQNLPIYGNCTYINNYNDNYAYLYDENDNFEWHADDHAVNDTIEIIEDCDICDFEYSFDQYDQISLTVHDSYIHELK